MDGLTLLAEARAAGLSIQAKGDRLFIRGPKRAESLARQLITRKAEVLRLLAAPPDPPIRLHPEALREALGPNPNPGALRALEAEVREALAQLQEEIRTGRLGGGPILVRRVPLALWLDLDDVARLLPGTLERRRSEEVQR